MMDLDDLDSFIANIEQSAPPEESDDSRHRCQECNYILEDVDGVFICPNCSAQATNILQLEETEMHYDEMGRAILGQRVDLREKKRKHTIEYGWAWSTDEVIVHLLSLQISALEKIGLLPMEFRLGVKNMWCKFWLENIAPYIQDEYNEDEMVPVQISRACKFRDVEILFKVQDKVMIPEKLANKLNKDPRAYKMFDTRFYRKTPTPAKSTGSVGNNNDLLLNKSVLSRTPSPSSDEENNEPGNRSLAISCEEIGETIEDNLQDKSLLNEMEIDNESETDSKLLNGIRNTNPQLASTRNISRDSITILTLNRTLAFLEATARCMNLLEPIFASDIIRACNQRLIPFFGGHKSLPDGIKLNHKDRFLFVKTRPPSPYQLTRTACHLIHKIYREKFPLLIPVPDLDTILVRIIEDMNLPCELLTIINEGKVSFSSFKQTRPIKFDVRQKSIQYVPQYDRWAFAILLCQLKTLFGLDTKSVKKQARAASAGSGEFVFHDWARQVSIRLQLIMSYDPYILFHPMADVKNLEPTPQVYNYLSTLMSDRVTSTARATPNILMYDESYRADLSEFLKREIPRPKMMGNELLPDEAELEMPYDFRHPILDAFNRTKRFWQTEMSKDREIYQLLFQDFSSKKVISKESSSKNWTIFENVDSKTKLDISPEWPYFFKLLLSIGGYLCYCEPKDILHELRYVEEFVYSDMKRNRRQTRGS